MRTSYRNIVLIDDDAINNLLNRQFLTFVLPGSNVTTFQDPMQVLRYLSDGKIVRPDLILLDINMPELSGWEFLDELATIDSRIEVMILSSSIHWADIDRSKTCPQVKCYIEKPLTEDKISRYIIHRNFAEIALD
jgi:CheY-like chemotaxis protein